MPRLLGSRYLDCFYCGRRTSTPFDTTTRRFDCTHCEATNFLDENGQITDPPVATDREATTPAKFAVLRPRPPPSSPSTEVFCKTCLKNQHLLRSILAQYLPDPDDPDYEAREKHYFAFRRHQEELYPQLCDDCEPRVLKRLEQAAYTAKTDALRRTIEKSMATRKKITSPRRLSFVDLVGGSLWVAGLVLQLFWHLSMLQRLYIQPTYTGPFSEDEIVTGGENDDLVINILGAMGPLLAILPAPEQSLKWSVFATVLGAWWNPRFIQVYRGFTKHITGISKWYMFQVIALAMRLGLQTVPSVLTPDASQHNKQLSFHLFTGALSILVSILAPHAIKIDTTPLFGASKPITIPKVPKGQGATVPTPQNRRRSLGGELNMIDLLEEIDGTSSSQAVRPPSPVSPQGSPILRPRPQQPSLYRPEPTLSNVNINGLNLAPATRYSEPMDWAPTASPYSAFNAGGSASQPQPQDPFRTRPAPAPPATSHRSFNHPSTTPLFPGAPPPPPRGAGGMFGRLPTHASRHRQQLLQRAEEPQDDDDDEEPQYPSQQQPHQPHQPVQFRDAHFFNPTRESDPRNSLSDMFSTSFNVADESPPKKTGGWGGLSSFASALAMGPTRKDKDVGSPPPTPQRRIEAAPAPAEATGVGGFPIGALGGGTQRETRAQRARREALEGSFGRGF
ncbi:Ima1 N-terminal domain-containing protein [Podospora conica]|nr:Ima1 N-terminal domain-containing protein [Schizothecium conicum]